MRRMIVVSLLALVGMSVNAAAQADAKQQGAPMAMMALRWSDLAGDWVATALRATNDSVVTQLTEHFTTDEKVSVTFVGRPAIDARVIAMGGDSVVTEIGPYPSVTRAGHTVTTRMTMHVRNHMA